MRLGYTQPALNRTADRGASAAAPRRPRLDRLEVENSAGLEVGDNGLCGVLGRQAGGVYPQVRLFGRLVRRVDPREVLQLAASGLLVKALRVALLGDRERRVDED